MNLRNKIFSFFGTNDHVNDINKDAEGKGTHQRFIELFGKYLDEEVLPLITNIVANNIAHQTVYPEYLPYREFENGIDFSLLGTEVERRKILKLVKIWHNVKGTKLGYRLMFRFIGVSMTFTEVFSESGLDSPISFDDGVRVFDSKCATCSAYTLALTGVAPASDDLDAAILAVIKFNEPVNAILTSWTYTQVATGGSFDASFDSSFN